VTIWGRKIATLLGLPLVEDHKPHRHHRKSLHDIQKCIWLHHLLTGTTIPIYCVFNSINKWQKFAGYSRAIWDQWGSKYVSQRHLQARLGPMNERCSAHLLLAPAYPCGAPVWRVADYCRATWVDEPYFSWVSSTLFTYVFYVSLQTCPPLTSTCDLFHRHDKPEEG
jgi:hypothetical protein